MRIPRATDDQFFKSRADRVRLLLWRNARPVTPDGVCGHLELMMSTAARRRMSAHEAKVAHLAKIGEVAKCIVDPVPSWLSEVLSDWTFDVRSQDSIDQMWPTRSQMWNSLAQAGNLAIQLQDLLRNAAMAGFVVTNSKLESEDSLKHLACPETESNARKARISGPFWRLSGSLAKYRNAWLGREDSNLRMVELKSVAKSQHASRL
jgi:hypothetical protein